MMENDFHFVSAIHDDLRNCKFEKNKTFSLCEVSVPSDYTQPVRFCNIYNLAKKHNFSLVPRNG